MALKSLSALAKAIDAVKKEAGSSEDHKALVEALAGVSKQIDTAEPAKADDSDDYSFEAAEKRHVARSAEIRDGGKSAATEGASEGGSDA